MALTHKRYVISQSYLAENYLEYGSVIRTQELITERKSSTDQNCSETIKSPNTFSSSFHSSSGSM